MAWARTKEREGTLFPDADSKIVLGASEVATSRPGALAFTVRPSNPRPRASRAPSEAMFFQGEAQEEAQEDQVFATMPHHCEICSLCPSAKARSSFYNTTACFANPLSA